MRYNRGERPTGKENKGMRNRERLLLGALLAMCVGVFAGFAYLFHGVVGLSFGISMVATIAVYLVILAIFGIIVWFG